MILMKNYEYRHQHEDHYNFLTPPLKIDHRSCQHHVTYKNIAKEEYVLRSVHEWPQRRGDLVCDTSRTVARRSITIWSRSGVPVF